MPCNQSEAHRSAKQRLPRCGKLTHPGAFPPQADYKPDAAERLNELRKELDNKRTMEAAVPATRIRDPAVALKDQSRRI